MHREIKANYPEMKISVVPGIVSIFSFASKIGVSVAEGAEKVSVIPSCYDLSTVKEIARNSESMIFLKDGRYFDQSDIKSGCSFMKRSPEKCGYACVTRTDLRVFKFRIAKSS